MRVLHVISSGGMYGAEAVILQLAAEMQAGRHGQSFLGIFSHAGHASPELHDVATASGHMSELVPCRGQLDLSVPGAIRDLASRVNAEIVHAHGYKADIYCYLAFRGRTRPALVSTCHTWYDNDRAVRLYGAADRWVLRHFDQVVAVSAEVEARLAKAGIVESRIHLIRNGVNVQQSERSLQTVSNGRTPLVRVGLVGRLAPEKGVDTFLRAVALLEGRAAGAQYIVAGEGPERVNLEALRHELRLDERVEMPGQQRAMDDFYASLGVQVSASRQEGLPMALLEGMARGLPIIATKVGEVPDVVVHGETGLLVDPNSPDALADAMVQLTMDEALRKRFGEAGRDRVKQHFSADRMASDYMAVYEEALASRRAAMPATSREETS